MAQVPSYYLASNGKCKSLQPPPQPIPLHTHELHAHEVYAHEVYAHEVYAHEVHAHEVHAHEVHAHEVHACEMHVYEVHAHEMHACEVHAQRDADDAYPLHGGHLVRPSNTSCSLRRSLGGKAPYPGA